MLTVLIGGQIAGTLDLSTAPQPAFEYDHDYRRRSDTPLSARFPLTSRRTGGEELRWWLEGLLPDDPDILDALCAEHRLDPQDSLRLLGTPMGADCAGAVQFCPPDATADLLADPGGQTPIPDAGIAEWLAQMQTDPARRAYRSEGADSGFSIAGMQPKVALRRTLDGWAVPRGALPTTHLLKATRAGVYPHEALIEHLTMRIAAFAGVAAARTEIGHCGDLEVVIVERFDRAAEGTVRIHQEDLCQALGRPPRRKYQRHGGPAPEDMARLLRETDPERADANLGRLLDNLLFQWIAASPDGHAKNFSILHPGDGSIRLSPLYDACSWLPYRKGKFEKKIQLAMKIGTDYSLSTADTPDALNRTAERLGLRLAQVVRRATEIAAAVPAALDEALRTLPSGMPVPAEAEALRQEFPDRAARCLETAEQAARRFRTPPSGVAPPVGGWEQPGRALATPAPASPRCHHIGVRTGKRCIRPPHKGSDHRY